MLNYECSLPGLMRGAGRTQQLRELMSAACIFLALKCNPIKDSDSIIDDSE